MTSSPSVTARRPPLLPDLLAEISVDRVLDTARKIEAKRSDTVDGWMRAHHGFDIPALWTTPYMWQAGVVAMREGVIAFDRLERDLLEAPAAWVHPEIGPQHYRVTRRAEEVQAPPLWPFTQDSPVADYESRTPNNKWWSHGLVHALIGFGWWEGLSEWELMAMARLSEAVAAGHWYNLAELGRLAQADMPIDLSWLRGHDAMRYASLEERSKRPDVRKANLGDPVAAGIVENLLETLRFEAFAYRGAVYQGDLFEPSDLLYLDLGEATEYAKVHIARLRSDAHRRWRESCLVPERDYATSVDGYERRAAAVLKSLLYYNEPSAPDARARGRRVLQDIGWRICHLAALEGASAGNDAALKAVADAITQIESEDADAVVASALEAAGASLGVSARRVLALGYRPTLDPEREPGAAREVRAQAYIERAWRIHASFGAALELMVPVARRAVSEPRLRDFSALAGFAEAAYRATEISIAGFAYLGWLAVPYTIWFQHPAEQARIRWSYRLARRHMPEDAATWDDYAVQWNPYLQRMPLPFDARWNDELRKATPGSLERFRPRPATAAFYVLVGVGRDGLVYLPVTPHLNALIQALRLPRRLGELVRMREFGADFMRQAIAEEAVLVFHAPALDREERNIDVIETAMQHASGIQQRREEPGPWNDDVMAKAYIDYCERSSLYRDTSAALLDFVGIPSDGRVAELGSGTGETTAEILKRLGPDGNVVGTDTAVLMLEHSMVRFADDPRAVFVIGAGRTVAFSAAGQRGFDRVVANSSIVLTDDIEAELAIVRRALEPQGKVAFSMPAEFVGVVDHMTTENAAVVSLALSAVQAEMQVAREAGKSDMALGSLDNLRRAMTAAGYEDLRFEIYKRPWTAAEYIDWLALPVVANALVGPGNEARAAELIEKLRARVDAALPLESAWLLAVGTRTDDPAEDDE